MINIGYLFKKKRFIYKTEKYDVYEFLDYGSAIIFKNKNKNKRCNIISGEYTGCYAGFVNDNGESDELIFIPEDVKDVISENGYNVDFLEIKRKKILEVSKFKYYIIEDSVNKLVPLTNEDLLNFIENYQTKSKLVIDHESIGIDWNELVPEISPYTILGIEEKEYSKEELLEIVENKINSIKNQGVVTLEKKEQIDKILDAYNMIVQNFHSKK